MIPVIGAKLNCYRRRCRRPDRRPNRRDCHQIRPRKYFYSNERGLFCDCIEIYIFSGNFVKKTLIHQRNAFKNLLSQLPCPTARQMGEWKTDFKKLESVLLGWTSPKRGVSTSNEKGKNASRFGNNRQ